MSRIDILNRDQSSIRTVPTQQVPLSISNAAVATKLDISGLPLIDGLYLSTQSLSNLEDQLSSITDPGKDAIVHFANAFFGQVGIGGSSILYVIYCAPSADPTFPFVSTAVINARVSIKLNTPGGATFFGLGFDDFDTLFTFDEPPATASTDYLVNINDFRAKFTDPNENLGQMFIMYQSAVNAQIALTALNTVDTASYYAQIGALNLLTNVWIANNLFPMPTVVEVPPLPQPSDNRVDGAVLGYGSTISLINLASFAFDGREFSGIRGFPVRNTAGWPFPYGPLGLPSSINNIVNRNNIYAAAAGRAQFALGELNLEFVNIVNITDSYVDAFLLDSLNSILEPEFQPAALPFNVDGSNYVLGVIQSTMKTLVSANAIDPNFTVTPNPAQSYAGDAGILGPYVIDFTTAGRVHSIQFNGVQRT